MFLHDDTNKDTGGQKHQSTYRYFNYAGREKMYKQWDWSAWCTVGRHVWINCQVMTWGYSQLAPCSGCPPGTRGHLPSASSVDVPPFLLVCWRQTSSELKKSHASEILMTRLSSEKSNLPFCLHTESHSHPCVIKLDFVQHRNLTGI